uniref:DNA-directed RNA polymerase n=1 Tax=Strongyloides papillosus TaxID=174720 RepID=A0A0N5B2F0_STREA
MSKAILKQLKGTLIKQYEALEHVTALSTIKASAQSSIVKSYFTKDYMTIVRTMLQYRYRENYKHGPDYVDGIGLLVLDKFLKEMDNSESFLDATTTLLKEIPLKNNIETQLSYLLFLNNLQVWCQNKNFTEDQKNEIMESLWDRVNSENIKPNLFLNTRIHSQEDLETARKIALDVIEEDSSTPFWKSNQRYAKDLQLVENLQSPVSESKFLPSEDKAINSKEKFMELFKEQLSNECKTYFKVHNISRDSKECLTAEKIVENLGWLSKIKEIYVERQKILGDKEVSSILLFFKPDEMALIIYNEAVRMLTNGQNMINYATFENNVTRSILQHVQKYFTKDILKHDDEMYIQVFDKYIDLFLNDNLKRLFRPREYWHKICDELNVSPDTSEPFSDIGASITKQKLSIFLSQILAESCVLTQNEIIEIEKKHPDLGLNSKYIKRIEVFKVRTVSKKQQQLSEDEEFIDDGKFFSIDKKFLQYLDYYQFSELVFDTGVEMPMLVPPRPYLDYGKSGPLYTSNSIIIRDKGVYSKGYMDRLMRMKLKNRIQARPVWDAVNELGCVPWKINKPVLEVMIDIFTNYASDPKNEIFLEKLGFPLNHKSIVMPDFKDYIDPNNTSPNNIGREKYHAYYKQKKLIENKKSKMNSLTFWLLYRLSLANHFKDSILYFPHNMDFRGRVYPTSPYLSHMGDDVSRSLLVFADGRKLGSDGLRWLKLHCINLTGHLKKETIEKRLEYVEEVLVEKIIDSARNPLDGSRWWMESEEPWQTLTACIEIDNAMKLPDPSEFISYMPIHQDGSCNGLQHYAALGRDKDGGREVNLLPSDKPADIYSVVASKVDSKREIDENSKNGDIKKIALLLRKEIPDKLPRKLLKQTVMTTVYGVTEYGAVLQIAKQLRNMHINPDNVGPLANYLKNKTLTSLSEAFSTSMALKEWFRKCAGQITGTYNSVEWITPLGLPVTQPYVEIQSSDEDKFYVPMKFKQINAFPPNYVHSLDSTHMMMTALNCTARNVTFAAVHDCFWTHASTVPEMNEITRNEFINLHSQPLTDNLANHFKETYINNSRTTVNDKTKEKLCKVFDHKIKKGELDLNEIRNSVYFFS